MRSVTGFVVLEATLPNELFCCRDCWCQFFCHHFFLFLWRVRLWWCQKKKLCTSEVLWWGCGISLKSTYSLENLKMRGVGPALQYVNDSVHAFFTAHEKSSKRVGFLVWPTHRFSPLKLPQNPDPNFSQPVPRNTRKCSPKPLFSPTSTLLPRNEPASPEKSDSVIDNRIVLPPKTQSPKQNTKNEKEIESWWVWASLIDLLHFQCPFHLQHLSVVSVKTSVQKDHLFKPSLGWDSVFQDHQTTDEDFILGPLKSANMHIPFKTWSNLFLFLYMVAWNCWFIEFMVPWRQILSRSDNPAGIMMYKIMFLGGYKAKGWRKMQKTTFFWYFLRMGCRPTLANDPQTQQPTRLFIQIFLFFVQASMRPPYNIMEKFRRTSTVITVLGVMKRFECYHFEFIWVSGTHKPTKKVIEVFISLWYSPFLPTATATERLKHLTIHQLHLWTLTVTAIYDSHIGYTWSIHSGSCNKFLTPGKSAGLPFLKHSVWRTYSKPSI